MTDTKIDNFSEKLKIFERAEIKEFRGNISSLQMDIKVLREQHLIVAQHLKLINRAQLILALAVLISSTLLLFDRL